MNEKVNGITLRTVNYKDSDRILTLFTLEKGKITANARGVRKANAKMKQVAEPFCFAETILAEKSGRTVKKDYAYPDGLCSGNSSGQAILIPRSHTITIQNG
jgi:hypothetical protein